MSISLLSAPAVEPVTLADFKGQCGLSPMESSDHVKELQISQLGRRYIKTAREEIETRTRRCLITQTWRLKLDRWPHQPFEYGGRRYPSVIVLPKPPFQSIVAFTYIDTSGTSQDMTPYTWQTDTGSETQPAKLYPPWAQPWPPVRMVPNNVTIDFKCGYGDSGASVPSKLNTAILAFAHSLYDPTFYKDIDKFVDNLIAGYVNNVA